MRGPETQQVRFDGAQTLRGGCTKTSVFFFFFDKTNPDNNKNESFKKKGEKIVKKGDTRR